MTNTAKIPAYVRLLFNKHGASGPALQAAMGRVYAPTAYQLRPIAARLGYDFRTLGKGKDGLTRYAFRKAA